MLVRCKQAGGYRAREGTVAFTLMEVLFTIVFLTLSIAGLITGYVQINRLALWSSMSLAAQSLASQGMEQARCAQWNAEAYPYTNGPGTTDELPVPFTVGASVTNNISGTNYALDVPATGTPFYGTNFITLTCVSVTPPLRMIRSDCYWTFPADGKVYVNTVVTYRAPDQ